MRKIILAVSTASALAVGALPIAIGAAEAAPTVPAAVSAPMAKAPKYKFKNCTALNKVYGHGVGKDHAKDKTSGKRVTTFKHSTSLYKKVVGYHGDLDRDKDGIACEKR